MKYELRFGDYGQNQKAANSFAKDVDLMLGNSVGNLLEGRGSVGNLPGTVCEEGGAVELGGPRGKSGDSADLILDKNKLVPANNQSVNELAVGESCNSIYNGSTVDS